MKDAAAAVRARRPRLIRSAVAALVLGLCVWLFVTDGAAFRWLARLHGDRQAMQVMLDGWGALAPVVFIALQATLVIIPLVHSSVLGLLAGFVFGQWLGFLYSLTGLTIGSALAFSIGRQLGAPFVRRLVAPWIWQRVRFIAEGKGGLFCLMLYLLPGAPKNIAAYLFGISPIPFLVFAAVSTLGRVPGVLLASTQGAKVAAGEYLDLILLTALVVALSLPLYHYRARLVAWARRRS